VQLVPADTKLGLQVPKPSHVSGRSQSVLLELPHGVPAALLAKEQVPSPLQVPGWWHWSGAAHV